MSTEAQRNAANGSGNMFTLSADLSEIAPVAPIARNGYAPFAESTPDTLVATGPIVAPFPREVRATPLTSEFPLFNAAFEANAKANMGTSRLYINFLGDSKTHGTGSCGNSPPTDACDVKRSWPSWFRKLFVDAFGVSYGIVGIPKTNLGEKTDYRWKSVPASWWQYAFGVGNRCSYNHSGNNTDPLVFWDPDSELDWDQARLFQFSTGSGTGGPGTITATGGTPTVYDVSVGGWRTGFVATAARRDRWNEVAMINTSAKATLCGGFELTDSKSGNPVIFANFGVGSSAVADWISTTATGKGSALPRLMNPALTIISFGTNEATIHLAPATFVANMQQLVNDNAGTGEVVVIPPFPVADATVQSWLEQYVSAMRVPGALSGCLNLYNSSLWEQWKAAAYTAINANLHYDAVGYKMIANSVFRRLVYGS